MENHDFVTARFTRNDRSTVMARWRSKTETDKNGEPIYRNENMVADPSNVLYQNILKHITVDELHENTINWARAEREGYERIVENIAKNAGDFIDVSDDTQFAEKLVKVMDENYQTNNETIFKFKLALFETQKIKESKDRKLKAKLRKAQSYREIIEVVLEF